MKAQANIKIDSLSYPVHIGYNLGQEIIGILEPFLKSGGVYIFTDHNTHRFCYPMLLDDIPILAQQPVYSIEPGERSKDIQALSGIWTWLMENGAGRNSLLINLGGGVVSDLGGFAAATFNRGMQYVNIPTSLIGQVDAAIGGKSALNVSGIKNQAGLFYDPAAVFILPAFLETLPEDHYISGFAEIIKCAALSGGKFWEMVKLTSASDRQDIFHLIYEAVKYKSRIVAQDPFENSGRKMLNFGHTVGHAIESFHNTAGREMILHGQAISTGMICEARLSNILAGMADGELNELSSLINSNFKLNRIEENAFEEIAGIINYDKKKSGKGIVFSLLEGLGKHSPGIVVNNIDLIESFRYYNRITGQ